jgi:hypothetical protein
MLISAVLLFFSAGNVEIFPVTVLGFVLPALVFSLARDRALVLPLSLVAVATFIPLLVNLLAPGNSVRLEQMEGSRETQIVSLLSMTAGTVFDSGIRWGLNEWIMLPLIFSAPLFWNLNTRFRSPLVPLFLITATVYGVFLIYLPTLAGLGFVVGRVHNIAILFFTIGAYAFLAVTTGLLKSYISQRVALWAWLVVGAALILVAFSQQYPRENKIEIAYREAFGGMATEYEQAQRQRANLVKNCAGETVVLPRLAVLPVCLVPVYVELDSGGRDVLGNDPKRWFNRVYAEYYGKSSVLVGKEQSVVCE